MNEVSTLYLSWLPLTLAGASVGFLGVFLGFCLAQRLRKPLSEVPEAYKARMDTQRRLLDSAERANQGLLQAMEVLEWAAGTDRLTGAWNRRRFEEAATAEMALVRRRKGPASLMIFDLDFFKRVNDTYGHSVGDTVLVEIAHTTRDQLRASDALVRWGGEEFIVLCPATRIDGAWSMAEKIRSAIAARTFPGVGQVTVSIGVAEYLPDEDLDSWIRRADKALYSAKENGRNQVIVGHSGHEDEGIPPTIIEIAWEDAYTSGHPTIDAQHRKLFALANSLLGAIGSKQPSPEISMRLRRLMAHIAQHFHDEEALLARAGYRELTAHSNEHLRLLERASQFETAVESGTVDISQFVGFLVLDLVQGHVIIEDKAFFHLFHPQGKTPP